MAICPIIVHFSTWRVRSMHDVVCEFARAAVRSKDVQKQLVRTSLKQQFMKSDQKRDCNVSKACLCLNRSEIRCHSTLRSSTDHHRNVDVECAAFELMCAPAKNA